MTTKKRKAACLLAVLLIFTLFCSATFIAFGSGHDCTGDDCRVCRITAVCRRAPEVIAASVLSACCLFLLRRGRAAAVFQTDRAVRRASLSSLKVKLLD